MNRNVSNVHRDAGKVYCFRSKLHNVVQRAKCSKRIYFTLRISHDNSTLHTTSWVMGRGKDVLWAANPTLFVVSCTLSPRSLD